MVQLANPGGLRPESEAPLGHKRSAAEVKLEVEELLEEQHGLDDKRLKLSGPFQQRNTDASTQSPQQPQQSLLCESSPLGLRLKKSPSFVDLIQMRLSQGNSSQACSGNGDNTEVGKKKDTKSIPGSADRLKASNFPATLLRIGTWECVSRYEGDLVAKCYFAKRKLVWEVLDGGLKNKIEIQWSDITAIKATCPDNGPSTLDIVLARQPLFFKETNPQPRKHTLWQATSDFTGGQASLHRRHFLHVPQGLLSKHFEKLIQCDPRLNNQPDVSLNSSYFDSTCSVFEDQDETKCLDHIKVENGSPFSELHDAASPSTFSYSKIETRESKTSNLLSWENPSPSSVMDSRAIEGNTTCETGGHKKFNKWDRFKLPAFHPSLFVDDLGTYVGHYNSEQIISDSHQYPVDAFSNEDLEKLNKHMFSDSLTSTVFDENYLLSRVNSLYNLLGTPATNQGLQVKEDDHEDDVAEDEHLDSPLCSSLVQKSLHGLEIENEKCSNASTGKQQPLITRDDSVGDMLLYLPRIASLPRIGSFSMFYASVAEDAENKSR